MSLAQLEEELPKLTPEELAHLRAAIDALRRPVVRRATPEMLAERRRLADEVMRGEWSAELANYEADQAKDREKNEELHGRWID